jgi:hypothetical protein
MALTGNVHVAEHFMAAHPRFHGLRSQDELEYVLNGYDVDSESRDLARSSQQRDSAVIAAFLLKMFWGRYQAGEVSEQNSRRQPSQSSSLAGRSAVRQRSTITSIAASPQNVVRYVA